MIHKPTIVLVQPIVGLLDQIKDKPAIPLSLISAVSKLTAEFRVRIVDQRVSQHWKEELRLELEHHKPILVGTTAMLGEQIKYALQIMHYVKETSSVPTVWGGSQGGIMPEITIRHPDIDYVVQGDGEDALLFLSRAIANQRATEIENVPGVWMKDGWNAAKGEWQILNRVHYQQVKLDDQPDPLYDYFADSIRQYLPTRFGEPTLDVELSRGCPFQCQFCLPRDTKILMADMRWTDIQDVHIGDEVVGVEKDPLTQRYKYKVAKVENTFRRRDEVWAIESDSGTVRSTKDHPWLMRADWKSLQDVENSIKHNGKIDSCRSRLRFVSHPQQQSATLNDNYRRGYISGAFNGDGCLYIRTGTNGRKTASGAKKYSYLYAHLTGDTEMQDRVLQYAADLGIRLLSRPFQSKEFPNLTRHVITSEHKVAERLRGLVEYDDESDTEFMRGFLAGIYDAEGSYASTLRIANTNDELLKRIERYLCINNFSTKREGQGTRLLGGFPEVVRFLTYTQPAVTHKKRIEGRQVWSAGGQIKRTYMLGEMDVHNLQTSTRNFVADGFVTHNCYNPYLHHGWRALSAKRANERLRSLNTNYGIKSFWFVDDEFFINLDRAIHIVETCHQMGWLWSIQGVTIRSVLQMDRKYLEHLKRYGCKQLNIGVESGSPRVLRMIRKPITPEEVIRVNQLLKEIGIIPSYYFVVGFPDETKTDIWMTLDLITRLLKENPAAKVMNCGTYQPYPHSGLEPRCVELGYKPPQKLEDYINFGVDQENLPWQIGNRDIIGANFCNYFLDRKIYDLKVNPLITIGYHLYKPIAWWRYTHHNFNFPVDIKLGNWLKSRIRSV